MRKLKSCPPKVGTYSTARLTTCLPSYNAVTRFEDYKQPQHTMA